VITDARLCAGAVAPVPLRLRAAERALVDRPADLETCVRASQEAVASSRTLGGNAYKRQILEAMVRRSLKEAVDLAGGSLSVAMGAPEDQDASSGLSAATD